MFTARCLYQRNGEDWESEMTKQYHSDLKTMQVHKLLLITVVPSWQEEIEFW
jgi:hypothetical protein